MGYMYFVRENFTLNEIDYEIIENDSCENYHTNALEN